MHEIEVVFNKVVTLTNHMTVNNEIITDKRVVENILRSLTRKLEYVVVAIEKSKYLNTFP